MARSLKKGPYVDLRLLKKVDAARASSDKRPIKLVASFYHFARFYRFDHRCTYWPYPRAGIYQRQHGWPEVRRVLIDPYL